MVMTACWSVPEGKFAAEARNASSRLGRASRSGVRLLWREKSPQTFSDSAVGARTRREATGLAGHQEDTSVAGTAAAVDVATAREWAVAKAATEAMVVRAA